MSAAMRKTVGVILMMGWTIASSPSCKKSKEEKARSLEGPQPSMNLVLKYTAGPPNGLSLLTIRIFGGTSGGAAAAAKRKATGQVAGQPQAVQVMDIAPDFWTKSVQFYAADGVDPAATVRLEQGINLISAPAVQKLQLGPDSFYRAVYSLSGSAAPSPGKELKAAVFHGGKRYDSNAVIVPRAPADEWDRWVQEAVVSLQLGQFDSVLKAADGMIALRPEAHHGFWYRGLALEAAGKFSEALATMRQALEKYPKSTKERYQEPPDNIYLKIRELRSRSR